MSLFSLPHKNFHETNPSSSSCQFKTSKEISDQKCVKTCGLQMSLKKRNCFSIPNDFNFEVKDRICFQMSKLDGLTFVDSMSIGGF